MSRALRVFLVGAGAILLLVGMVAAYMVISFMSTPGRPTSEVVIFEVKPATSFMVVADQLHRSGVITNPQHFYLYARFRGLRSQLRVGEYELNTQMRPEQVLNIITSGKSRAKPFVVPEGYNIYEIAELYEKQGFGRRAEFLALAKDRQFIKQLLAEDYISLEGYLFPDTYQITKFTSTRELLTAMVRHFQLVYADIIQTESLPGWSRNQIVTLASIIEKETGAPEERRRISAVFHNRLQKKMRLQTDPTILYGMAVEQGKMPNNIRKADILKATLYNTYVIRGLPPGPIANPGREALMAAVDPEDSDYLFFVSQNDGTHIFSTTYEEHNRAVRKFQMDPAARRGKSWRDLNKKQNR